MSSFKVQVKAIEKLLGDFDEVILTKGNVLTLNIEHTDGSIAAVIALKSENSCQINFDPESGKTTDVNALVGIPLNKDHKLAEIFFKHEHLYGNLMLFEFHTILRTKLELIAPKQCTSRVVNREEEEENMLKREANATITKLWNM